jgi:hypothetical protein
MRELFGKRYAARSHRPHLACRHVGLPQIVARLGVPDRSLVANSQFVAAFRAAPCENCPAILARHAGTETMSLRPFAVIGLKCTFWHLGSITTGRRAPVARPCTIMDSAFSIHELDVGQDGNPMPLSFLHRCRLDSDLGGTGFSRCDERDSPGFFAQAEACTTTKSSFLCAPRRIVGQAILPAAGFRAGSAVDVQFRPAGWKAGCSQDWLPHLAAKPHCATLSCASSGHILRPIGIGLPGSCYPARHGRLCAQNLVHGGGALQEQGCCSRVSPVSGQRPYDARRSAVRVQLGRRETRTLLPAYGDPRPAPLR